MPAAYWSKARGRISSPAKVSRQLPLRLAHQPKSIQDISWKAQVELCKRYRRLVAKGKHANVVTVAIAQELVGLCGPLLRRFPSPCKNPKTVWETPSLYGNPLRRCTNVYMRRDAAPVRCHPRRREETAGYSSLD